LRFYCLIVKELHHKTSQKHIRTPALLNDFIGFPVSRLQLLPDRAARHLQRYSAVMHQRVTR
jgi:hypothetical protein